MLLKHPQASPPETSLPVPDSAVIDESCVVKCLNTFPTGTAPGPSGLRVYHLKEALLCPSPWVNSLYLKSSCSFVNVPCSGYSRTNSVQLNTLLHIYRYQARTYEGFRGFRKNPSDVEINYS